MDRKISKSVLVLQKNRTEKRKREMEGDRERGSSRKTHRQHEPRKTDEMTGAHSVGKITNYEQK